MAEAFVGGVDLVAAFGELFRAVMEAKETVSEFRPQFEKLSSTLACIRPYIDYIDRCNRDLDRTGKMDRIREIMSRGAKLVRTSANVGKVNVIMRYHYSKKLGELNKSVAEFFVVDMQAMILREGKETLEEVKVLSQDVRKLTDAVEARRGGYFVDYVVPQAPDVVIGRDTERCFEEIKGNLLRGGSSATVVSAPGGCGKSTLVTALEDAVSTSATEDGQEFSEHPKSLSSARGESNANASFHPLPLPPSAALHSPSSRPQPSIMTETMLIKGQWKKGKLIGRGTFGSVYVASNRETGALCAMKEVELCADDPKSQESMKQLEQEINMLSRLKHPNIVQYYGSEIVDDRFYIYLEYVHPGSINKYIRDHCGAITESVVRNFTRHILSGLAYLHREKTIHRDIKGANLLVDASGVVKLADFGVAKHLTGQAADLSLKGSPYWMAPELIYSVMKKDNSDHAFAIDIWSLGCTIIEMLTGKPPWSEFEGAAAMFRVLRDNPPIPDMLSSEGKDFLRCCFQRNPAERPSATKLLDHQFLESSMQLDLSAIVH